MRWRLNRPVSLLSVHFRGFPATSRRGASRRRAARSRWLGASERRPEPATWLWFVRSPLPSRCPLTDCLATAWATWVHNQEACQDSVALLGPDIRWAILRV